MIKNQSNVLFFFEQSALYTCPICEKGTANILNDEISGFLIKVKQRVNFEKEQDFICKICSYPIAKKFCYTCKMLFCDRCCQEMHFDPMFQTHSIEPIQNNNSKCYANIMCSSCSKNKNIDIFCIQCKTLVCKQCLNSHFDHRQISLSELLIKFENFTVSQENSAKKIIDSLECSKTKILKKTSEELNKFTMELNEKIDLLIGSLNELKSSVNIKIKNEFNEINQQFDFLGIFLQYLHQESNLKKQLPNKLFQILQNFPFLNNSFGTLLDSFKIKSHAEKYINDLNDSLEKLKLKIQDENYKLFYFSEDKIRVTSTLTQSPTFNSLNLDSKYFNFTRHPIEVLEKSSKLLDKGSFCPYWLKSNVSCSFIYQNQTFLSWAGHLKQNKKVTYPLIMYNLTTAKFKKTLLCPENTSYITCVSTFPTEGMNYDNKKLLYFGDSSGVVRFFDFADKFTQFHKIETNTGRPILSVNVFYDIYNELENFNKDILDLSEYFYAIISFFDEKLPLRIYKFEKKAQEEGNWRSIIEIPNILNKECRTISVYDIEYQDKTLIFCGFTTSFIKIYNLKENTWDQNKQFPTKSPVNSMKFVKRENSLDKNKGDSVLKIQYYLIFAQENNTISIADIELGEIIRQVSLENVSRVFDLCLWNNEYIIIAAYSENSVKILNFENLQVIKTKKLKANQDPANIIKAIEINPKKKQKGECLVLFRSIGNNSKIKIYG